MVIHNFNVMGIRCAPPFKANSPAVIDADRILPGPVAVQFFQPVARRGLKVNERVRGVEHGKLTVCYRLNISWNFLRPFPHENFAGFFILERDNHTAIISRFTINGKPLIIVFFAANNSSVVDQVDSFILGVLAQDGKVIVVKEGVF